MTTVTHFYVHREIQDAILQAKLLGSDHIILPIGTAVFFQRKHEDVAKDIVMAMHLAKTVDHDLPSVIGGKIHAIKALRNLAFLPLKETKDLIENALADLGYPKPGTQPQDYERPEP